MLLSLFAILFSRLTMDFAFDAVVMASVCSMRAWKVMSYDGLFEMHFPKAL